MKSAFPEARIVETARLSIATYECGKGPAVIFCHGYPELAFTWRHILPGIAALGYRAIAIDMPGCGASERPTAVEDYGSAQIGGYLIDLLDALGIESAIFVGHDFGAAFVWELPRLHPARVRGVVSLNTPRMKYRNWGPQPLAWLRQAYGSGHYMLAYQVPGFAEDYLAANIDSFFTGLFTKHAQTIEVAFANEHVRNLDLEALGALPKGPPLMPAADVEVFIDAYRRTGFTGALNWYRNMQNNADQMHDTSPRIDVPCLMLAASDDIFNPPETSASMEAFIPDLECHVLEGCGHWMPDEAPDEVVSLLGGWLQRRFPASAGNA